MKEQWREIDEKDVEKFSQAVAEEFMERRQVGIRKYGTEFQGDPLVHQREEILDSLFYNWASLNERKWLREKTNELLDEVIAYFGNNLIYHSTEKEYWEAKKIAFNAKEIKNA